jgi:hypothetical protein
LSPVFRVANGWSLIELDLCSSVQPRGWVFETRGLGIDVTPGAVGRLEELLDLSEVEEEAAALGAGFDG